MTEQDAASGGNRRDTAGVIAPPPLLLLLAILLGLALEWLLPLPWPRAEWLYLLGWALVGLGLGAAIALFAQFRRAGTNVETYKPSIALVTDGVFKVTRNPGYLGMFLFLAGLALAAKNPWLLVVLVPFALVMHYYVVLREERYLERKFGQAYRDYKARVRRWV